MPRIAQRDASQYLARLADFQGNGSLRGAMEYARPAYVVWSYATPILAIDTDARRIIHNTRRYSVTTSKQQSYLTNGTAALLADGYTLQQVHGEGELWDTLNNREKSSNLDHPTTEKER